jgi:hypothetical protein
VEDAEPYSNNVVERVKKSFLLLSSGFIYMKPMLQIHREIVKPFMAF